MRLATPASVDSSRRLFFMRDRVGLIQNTCGDDHGGESEQQPGTNCSWHQNRGPTQGEDGGHRKDELIR